MDLPDPADTGAVLEAVAALVEADPHAGPALVLYALARTLASPRGGCMYRLDKLAHLAPEHRRLAYGLMEVMARGEARGPVWEAFLARLDAAYTRR